MAACLIKGTAGMRGTPRCGLCWEVLGLEGERSKGRDVLISSAGTDARSVCVTGKVAMITLALKQRVKR